MKTIKRDLYLNRLIERRENDLIKVVTGIRRCGKSYLLFKLYYQYLLDSGVEGDRIISVSLDDEDYSELRDSKKLSSYIKERITNDGMWYVFLDEVQMCRGFESVLNGLNRRENLDIYVTGSDSKFLSTDVLTEFRGRGDEVRVYPLSFSEYVSAYSGDKYDAWIDYCTYGGLPLILNRKTDELKSKYLIDLCQELYLKDIEERHKLSGDNCMAALVNVLASAVGSPANRQNWQTPSAVMESMSVIKPLEFISDICWMSFLSAKQNDMISKEKDILLLPLSIISRMWGCAMLS